MNIFHETFTTGQVVKAAQVSNATLQSWLKRGVIIGHRKGAEIEGGGSPGRYRQYSFHNVMEIATAKALIDCGFKDVPKAFQAASRFSHVGTGAIQGHHPQRMPGVPFETTHQQPGLTYLCVSGDHFFLQFWSPEEDILPLVRTGLGKPLGFLMLDMSELFNRVMFSLGYHPEEVMELAYSRND